MIFQDHDCAYIRSVNYGKDMSHIICVKRKCLISRRCDEKECYIQGQNKKIGKQKNKETKIGKIFRLFASQRCCLHRGNIYIPNLNNKSTRRVMIAWHIKTTPVKNG